MKNWTQAAVTLKALLERKFKLSLDFLRSESNSSKDSQESENEIRLASELSQHGIFGLRSDSVLTFEQRLEIKDAFNKVLGGLADLHTQRHDLDLANSIFDRAQEEQPSNVIPFRRSRTGLSTGSVSKNPSRSGWVLKQDCLIEAAHVSEIHKMALEIHGLASRYAFIDFRDLEPDTRQSARTLAALGEINIFIPELVELPLAEQKALTELIHMNTLDRPLLMVGTTVAYSDLRSDARVHLELLNLLSRVYIKLTRPFSEYKDEGLIHYFLDSLSESPT